MWRIRQGTRKQECSVPPARRAYIQLGTLDTEAPKSSTPQKQKLIKKISLTTHSSTTTVIATYDKIRQVAAVVCVVAHMKNSTGGAVENLLHAAWCHTIPESTSSHRDQTHRAKRVEDAVARETKHLNTRRKNIHTHTQRATWS